MNVRELSRRIDYFLEHCGIPKWEPTEEERKKIWEQISEADWFKRIFKEYYDTKDKRNI